MAAKCERIVNNEGEHSRQQVPPNRASELLYSKSLCVVPADALGIRRRGLETMSTTTIDLDELTYGQPLGRTLPHVIHTDEESERLTNELLRLDERENPSPGEKELAELLTMLIDEYEEHRGLQPDPCGGPVILPSVRSTEARSITVDGAQ
jgi:hypothetical protein